MASSEGRALEAAVTDLPPTENGSSSAPPPRKPSVSASGSTKITPAPVKAPSLANPKSEDRMPPNESKAPSGAELKKRAKAEKAARREKERQQAQQAQGQPSQTGAAAASKNGAKGHGAVSAVGGQQSHQQGHQRKRTGSMAVHDKPLPIRSAGSSGPGGSKLHMTPSADSKPSSSSKKDTKQVALFSHLYTHSRRTSIAGVSKDVHPAVLALGLQFSNYVICGSSARCVATLLVFKRVIESYTTPPGTTLTRHLSSHLSLQIDHLVSCRPLSVSMGNAIRWLKLEISHVDISTRDADAKTHLCAAIDNFIRERITVADQVIATSAAAKIVPGDVILTYAKSSIVLQTLLLAHRNLQPSSPSSPPFRVILIDSRPLFEARSLARSLLAANIPVTYTLLSGLSHAISSATKVFLGAHAMMSNGRLFSRVGTAAVAMAAHEADLPVIVCCESVKFTERVALDSVVMNEIGDAEELVGASGQGAGKGLEKWRDTHNLQLLNLMYDVTPAEYIEMVITEYGSLPPSSVPVVHRLSTNT